MPKAKQSATSDGLTPKEQMFVAQYLIDGNGTRAALAAGYSTNGARRSASELLKRPRVQDALKAAKAKVLDRLETSAAMVLENIARVAGKAERSRQFGAALKGLELLGKHHKLFTEKHEHGGIGGGPIPVAMSADEFRAIARELLSKV